MTPLGAQRSGRRTVKRAPPPVGFEASTVPPWALTRAATIARPRPAPPSSRPRESESRQKRSKTAFGSPGGRPGPWSRDGDVAHASRRLQPDLDRRALRGVDDRVAQQVGEDAAQRVAVGPSRHRPGRAQGDRPLRRRGPGVVAGVLEQLAQVERFARRLAHLVDPRQRQQVVDQAAHPRRLGLDPRHRPLDLGRLPRRADPVELAVAADRGERRAQLVRGVGEEPAQPPLPRRALGEGRLDLHQHRVQGPSQAADLGAVVVRLDPPREVAGGDLPRHLAHPPQRPQPDPDQPPGGEAEGDQDRGADDELDQRQVAQGRVRCRRAAPRRPSPTAFAEFDRGGAELFGAAAALADRDRRDRLPTGSRSGRAGSPARATSSPPNSKRLSGEDFAVGGAQLAEGARRQLRVRRRARGPLAPSPAGAGPNAARRRPSSPACSASWIRMKVSGTTADSSCWSTRS